MVFLCVIVHKPRSPMKEIAVNFENYDDLHGLLQNFTFYKNS